MVQQSVLDCWRVSSILVHWLDIPSYHDHIPIISPLCLVSSTDFFIIFQVSPGIMALGQERWGYFICLEIYTRDPQNYEVNDHYHSIVLIIILWIKNYDLHDHSSEMKI